MRSLIALPCEGETLAATLDDVAVDHEPAAVEREDRAAAEVA